MINLILWYKKNKLVIFFQIVELNGISFTMQIISGNEFNALCDDANHQILKYISNHKPKIIETADNAIIKVFYQKKKWYSRDRYYPKGKRFYNNANHLNHLNVMAPEVDKLQYCPELKLYTVKYKKYPGKECREWIAENQPVALSDVFQFIASLHAKGIFFRAIHLANILYDPKKGFALIDVADVYFKKKPLGLLARYRNIKHLFRAIEDKAYWQQVGIEKIMALYLAGTHYSPTVKKMMQFLGVLTIKFKVPYLRLSPNV